MERIGAQRVAIDTIELLLGAFGDDFTVRSELDRLFGWLKERQLTTVLTGERGRGDSLTRFGLEEYVSDCVVVLGSPGRQPDLHPPFAGDEISGLGARHERIPIPDHGPGLSGAADHLPGPGVSGQRTSWSPAVLHVSITCWAEGFTAAAPC